MTPENQPSSGKTNQARGLAGLLLGACLALPAWAGPEGGRIAAGQGEITQQNTLTQVHQHSQRLVVDWNSFNVARNEVVEFQQPNSSAVALNRIFDQAPSQIFGSIKANGRVFLSNPNGIVFGETARVDVGALVASSLSIGSDDFMAGRYRFAGAGMGRIINRGLIQAATGGSVTLAGSQVSNEGLIIADYGRIDLASGSLMTLAFDGTGLIRFEIDGDLAPASALSPAIANSGSLRADGGQVVLSVSEAQQVLDKAINNEGLIQAQRIDNSGGVIRLLGGDGTVVHSGIIDASGQEQGGRVEALGQRVALTGDARVDASGGRGGGEILIGGDYQGANPNLPNALQTLVGSSVQIDASARQTGEGGKVIVWADQATRFAGRIEARGGANAGDGGLVEVSGKQWLDFSGVVDTQAPAGQRGRLLLDPDTLNIVAGNSASDDDQINTTDDFLFAFSDGAATSSLSVGKLLDVLDVNDVTLQANNDIQVQAAIDASANTNSYSLELDAPTVSFDDGADITLNNGNLIIGNTQSGNVVLADNASVTLDTGSGSGNITINGSIDGGAGNESLTLIAGSGSINVTGGIGATNKLETLQLQEDAATSTGTVTLSGSLNVDTLSTYAQPYALTLNGGGTISNATIFANTGALVLGDNATDSFTFANGLTATAPSSISLAGGFTANSGALTLGDGDTPLSATADVSLNAPSISLADTSLADASTLTLGTGGNTAVSLSGISPVPGAKNTSLAITTTGTIDATGTMEVDTLSISQAGTTTLAGLAISTGTITTGNGDITLNGPIATNTGTLSLNSGTGSITANGTIDLASLNITQAGSATFTAPVTASTLDVSGVNGNISFQNTLNLDTFVTAAGNLDLELLGNSDIANATTFANTGILTLGDATGDSFAFANGLTATAPSSISLAGGFTSSGDITLGTTSLTANTRLTAASIDWRGPVTAGANSLVLDADTTVFSDNANITLSNAALTIGDTNSGNVTIAAGNSLSLSSGGGAVTIKGDISGSSGSVGGNLTLDAGAGSISVGGSTDLTSLTLSQSGGATFQGAVNANTLTLSDTSGDIVFQNDLTANTLSTTNQGYGLQLLGGTTSITSATTFANTGALVLGDAAGDSFTFTNGLTATAPSSISLAGGFTVNSGSLILGDGDTSLSIGADTTLEGANGNTIALAATTLADGITLTLGSGGTQAITLGALSGTTGGASSNLVINTTGSATFSGSIGSDIGTLTLTQSGGATFQGTVNANTLTLSDTSGDIVFQNNLTATTLNTTSQDYGLQLLGGNTSITNATTFANTGALVLGDAAGDSFTFANGLTATAPSSISLAGNFTSSGNINLAALTLSANTSFDAATITLGAATLADATQLSLGNGGNTAASLSSISKASGASNTALVINTTGAFTASGALTADAITISQSGGATFQGTVNSNNITLTDTIGDIVFQDNLTVNTGLTTNAKGYGLQLLGASNYIAGTTTFSNTGTLILGNDGNDSFTFVAGIQTGTNSEPSTTRLIGTLNSTNAAITLGNIALDGDLAISTGNASTSSISLGSVNSNGKKLQLNAGDNADISLEAFTGTGDITIINSNNTTFQGAVGANAITLSNSQGNIDFNGTVDIATLSTTGENYTLRLLAGGRIDSATSFINTGGLVLGDSINDTLEFTNGLTATTPSTIGTAGSIRTNNANITLGDLVLNADTTLDAGSATVEIGATSGSGKLEIISGSLTLGSYGSPNNPANDLTLPTTNNLTLTGDLYVNGGLDFSTVSNVILGAPRIVLQTASDNGPIKLRDTTVNGDSELILNSGGGLITLGLVGNTTTLRGLTVTNTGQTQLAGDIKVQTLDFSGAGNTVLTANTSITSGGDINLGGGNLDGAYRLSLDSGGDIILLRVGQTTALNGLALTASNGGLELGDAVNVQSSTRETLLFDASGTITITGNLDTGGSKLDIRSRSTPELRGSIATGGGELYIQTDGSTLTLEGDFTTGGGAIQLTSDTAINIGANASFVSSGGDVRIDTSGNFALFGNLDAGNGTITIASGDIDLNGALASALAIELRNDQGMGLGGGSNGLQLTSAELARITTPVLRLQSNGDIVVDGIALDDTTGVSERIELRADGGANSRVRFENNPSSFKFNLDALADDGVAVLADLTTEGNLRIDGDANAAADGNDNIVLGDNVSLNSAGDFILAAQSGNGLVLQGNMTIDTAAGSGTVDLRNIAVNGGSDVNQQYALTINTDSGDIFLGALGNDNPLDSVTINNTGTTTLSGDIYTRRSTGIDLSNTSQLVIAQDVVLDSSQGNGLINLGAPVEGPGSLTLLAGNGDVVLATAGQNEALGALLIDSDGQTQLQGRITTRDDIDLSGASQILITAASTLRSQNNAGIDLSGGSVSAQDSLALATAGQVRLAGQIESEGALDFSASPLIGIDGPLVMRANNGSPITLNGSIQGNDRLEISGGVLNLQGRIEVAGALELDGLGQIIADADTSLQGRRINVASTPVDGPGGLALTASERIDLYQLGTTTALNNVRIDNPGNTVLAGDIVTQGSAGVDLSGASDIELSVDISIDTTTNNGRIDLSGGAIDGPRTLELRSGSGEILLASLGQTTPLASLAITNSGQTRFNNSQITTQGAGILLADAKQIVLEGDTALTSTANDGRIELTGGNLEGPGGLALDAGNGDISLGPLGNNQALGSLSAAAKGVTTLAGDIISAGTIDFAAASQLLLSRDLELRASDATIDLSAGIDGAYSLSLNAGSGDILLGAVGATQALTRLTVTGTGLTRLTGNITIEPGGENGSAKPGILSADSIRRASDTATAINFTQAANLRLDNDILIDTQAANGRIDFSGAQIDGNYLLQLNSGNGDIILGAVGQKTALAGLVVDNQGNLILTDSVRADGNVELTTNALRQEKELRSQGGQVLVSATQDIDMAEAAITSSNGGLIDYRSQSGDIRIALLDAGNGQVKVRAGQGAVLSSTPSGTDLDQPPANVKAGNIDIYAKTRIGASSEETLVLEASDSIRLDSAGNDIYINNTQGAPITSPRTIIDVLADRRRASAEAQRVAPQFDVAPLFKHQNNRNNTPLFQVLQPQAEVALARQKGPNRIQTLTPEVPMLVKTPSGWELKRPLSGEDDEHRFAVDWL